MASALFASRNGSHWGEPKVYMRKTPKSTPTTTTSSSSNPNPNPNTNHHNPPSFGHEPNHTNHFQPSPRSEDRSSFSHPPPAGCPDPNPDPTGYVSFNLAAYSKEELKELRRRLVSELEQIRNLTSWIETRAFERDSTPAPSSVPPPLDLVRSDGSKQKKRPRPGPGPPGVAKRAGGELPEGLDSSMVKKCGQILTKLMKHKHGWVFNVPVDAVGMGLHDYHQIVKNPMDLGTVKVRLGKNYYGSPVEFAADVRLTFNNALLYNPKGHDVYIMADQLLRLFEDLFGPLHGRFEKQQRMDRQRGTHILVPESDRVEPPQSHPVSLPPAVPLPVKPLGPRTLGPPPVVRTKQPKPKAKDPNKREMSYEEKQKLSVGLESLPQEKMAQVLQIVGKKNPDLLVHDDEIELDFESLNTETLWELDRFVYNCKKTMSKIRRQEAISANTAVPPVAATVTPAAAIEDKVPAMVGETPDPTSIGKNRRVETGEEDVDIGDEEMPSGHFPPVVIEKDTRNDSSSSDSSSDSSSSSSESDSRSSSDSESDGDEAQSPGIGLRPPPQQPEGS